MNEKIELALSDSDCRGRVSVGDLVEIGLKLHEYDGGNDGSEPEWLFTRVTKIEDGVIHATLTNSPKHPYAKHGDALQFSRKNVFCIWYPENPDCMQASMDQLDIMRPILDRLHAAFGNPTNVWQAPIPSVWEFQTPHGKVSASLDYISAPVNAPELEWLRDFAKEQGRVFIKMHRTNYRTGELV